MGFGIQLKTKGFRQKLSRIEKDRRKMARKLAEANGAAFVEEAIRRTPLAGPTTKYTWDPSGGIIEHESPVATPNYGYSVSGWKAAARRVRVSFFAPHAGGYKEGEASIKMEKGTTIVRARLENHTSFIQTLDQGGTLPPLPPIAEKHAVQAANMLSGGIRAARRAAKRNQSEIAAKRLRKAWKRGK